MSSSVGATAGPVPRRGLLLILSSPSGAGKSSLTDRLTRHDDITLSVSVTTRARRPSEIEGEHYDFIGEAAFEELRARGDLLEWAQVHGNFYGTPRRPVEQALAAGRDMVFDIDWQGAAAIAGALPNDVATVFILPPSMAELKARLERRAEDSAEVIARRLANAREEIAHWQSYHYVIINDDLQRAYRELQAILIAERTRRERLVGLDAFVGGLLAQPA